MLLSGEPGIGKSRLIAALEERLAREPHQKLRYFCSPHHQDSALYPIIARWEQDLGFTGGEAPEARLHKLEAALLPLETPLDDISLIADLLSVATANRYPALDLDPQRKKEKTFDALLRVLANRARRQPLLMLFEDAHWADASSLELLDKAVSLLADLPILLLISFRPEFAPPWVGLAVASLITLRRLTQKESMQLAECVVVGRSLSPALLGRIITNTDGVPLFVEELTKALLEGAEASNGRSASLEVPATLQASLIARLDRIPAAKQVAQIGAVIGREFGRKLLAVVAHVPEAQLDDGIDTLVASGLAFRRGQPPEAIYTFKHALVRDAAYSTLLRSQRQELHARIASALEGSDIIANQPELLAHHYTHAGMTDRAIEHWRLAGLRAIGRSAHAEASAHFRIALELLGSLPPGDERDAQELDLRLDLALPLIALHGFGSASVEECALRTLALSDSHGGSSNRFAAHRLAWNSCLMRQPITKTISLARELFSLATASAESGEACRGSSVVGLLAADRRRISSSGYDPRPRRGSGRHCS